MDLPGVLKPKPAWTSLRPKGQLTAGCGQNRKAKRREEKERKERGVTTVPGIGSIFGRLPVVELKVGHPGEQSTKQTNKQSFSVFYGKPPTVFKNPDMKWAFMLCSILLFIPPPLV